MKIEIKKKIGNKTNNWLLIDIFLLVKIE